MERPRLKPALLLVWLAIPATCQIHNATPVKAAWDVLEQGADNPDPDVRREVAVALSLASRRDPSVSLLEKLAADKDYLVREAALVSIGELLDPRLAKAARTALHDDVPEVAFAAARALFRLHDPEGKELLIAIVEKDAPGKTSFARAKLRDATRRMKRPKTAMLFVVQQGIGFVPSRGSGWASRR
jgi:hypothetical protein